jgi:hypothetical protein
MKPEIPKVARDLYFKARTIVAADKRQAALHHVGLPEAKKSIRTLHNRMKKLRSDIEDIPPNVYLAYKNRHLLLGLSEQLDVLIADRCSWPVPHSLTGADKAFRAAKRPAEAVAVEAAETFNHLTGNAPGTATQTRKGREPGGKLTEPSGYYFELVKTLFAVLDIHASAEHYARKVSRDYRAKISAKEKRA